MAVNDYRIQIGENTKTFHANMLRKYVSREKNEDKRMNVDVVQGLQLVRKTKIVTWVVRMACFVRWKLLSHGQMFR